MPHPLEDATVAGVEVSWEEASDIRGIGFKMSLLEDDSSPSES